MMLLCSHIYSSEGDAVVQRGGEKVMPPGFNSGCLLAGHIRTSQRFAATFEKTVILKYNLQLRHSLLPPLNKSMYSQWVKVALPPLQPLAPIVLQCHVIGIVVASRAFF
jgi:hypothetical protein